MFFKEKPIPQRFPSDVQTEKGRAEYARLYPSLIKEHEGWAVIIPLDEVPGNIDHVCLPTVKEARAIASVMFPNVPWYQRCVCEDSLRTELIRTLGTYRPPKAVPP